MPCQCRECILKPNASLFFYRISQAPALGDFHPAQAGRANLKPSASLFLILSDLAGPGVGGGSGRAPKPLPAPSFLMEEKMEKDHLRGTPVPLKNPPAGEPSGRVPRPHGREPWWYSRHIGSQKVRSRYQKILLFIKAFTLSYNCPAGYSARFRRMPSGILGA